MPNVTFKVKVNPGTSCFTVPTIKHTHCDMPAFRVDPNFGAYANSNMFLQCVNAGLRKMKVTGVLDANNLPDGVTIEHRSLLSVVTVDLKDWR